MFLTRSLVRGGGLEVNDILIVNSDWNYCKWSWTAEMFAFIVFKISDCSGLSLADVCHMIWYCSVIALEDTSALSASHVGWLKARFISYIGRDVYTIFWGEAGQASKE